MNENFVDNRRKQASRRSSGSAEGAHASRPIPAALRLQKTRANTDTLNSRVLRKMLPLSMFHTVILPDSAVLSRGYFNFFINHRKRKVGKSKKSISILQEPVERVYNPFFFTGASTFASAPKIADKNPATLAENLNHLTETQFFRQNTAIVGQKSSAADKNRFYSEKIGRVAPKPGVFGSAPQTSIENRFFFPKISWIRLKSRSFLKNLVGATLHRVDSSKISWISLRTSWISLKSRGLSKIPVDFTLHRVDSSKISWISLRTLWISLKSRGLSKIPVDFSKTLWISQNSRGFRSVPDFIDISGHNPFLAVSIFNTDALFQDTYPSKISISLTGRCKHNSNLKININKEQGGFIWLIQAK